MNPWTVLRHAVKVADLLDEALECAKKGEALPAADLEPAQSKIKMSTSYTWQISDNPSSMDLRRTPKGAKEGGRKGEGLSLKR